MPPKKNISPFYLVSSQDMDMETAQNVLHYIVAAGNLFHRVANNPSLRSLLLSILSIEKKYIFLKKKKKKIVQNCTIYFLKLAYRTPKAYFTFAVNK